MTTAYGNPNSTDHATGEEAHNLVETARAHVAHLTGTSSGSVQFTSGSSESLALALKHATAAKTHVGPLRVALMPLEHKSLLDLVQEGARVGQYKVRWLQVSQRA